MIRKPKEYRTHRKRLRLNARRYLAALGALAASAPLAGAQTAQPPAVRDSSAAVKPQAAASSQTQRFQIPAGPLDQVLNRFGQVTGLRLQIDPGPSIASIGSAGLSGTFNFDQALQQLLGKTGLAYRFVAPGVVWIGVRKTQAVEVTATAQDSVTLTRYPLPRLETPQAIAVVPRSVLDAQSVSTLRDALRNVAGISLAAGEGGSQGDNLTIRGFSARNDIFLDGMRDFGSYYRDPFDMESVDVLEGPSSITFGRGSTGGVVNQETKAPQMAPLMSADLEFGSDRTRRITADLDRPLPHPAGGTALRLNLMGDEGGVAGRDVAENRRFGFAPSLALGLDTATQLTLNYFHLSEDDTPDYGIPWLFNAPAPVPHQNYYGFREANFLRANADIATAAVSHAIDAGWSVRDQVRYAHYDRDVQITEPQVKSTLSGAPLTSSTPLDDMAVTRNQLANDSTETFFWNQLDTTAYVQTGPIEHVLVAGTEGGRETSQPLRTTFSDIPETPLLHPDPDQPYYGTSSIRSANRTTAWSLGAYVVDTLKLGHGWELTGGVRWDRFDARDHQTIPENSTFRRIDEQPSWRGAILYQPTARGSFYADFATSFNPSAESLSLTAANANTPPESNRTFEVGTKWAFSSGRLNLRAGVFQTDKTNAREPDPDNPLLNVLGGDERVRGTEITVNGRISDQINLLASYAHMQSRVMESEFYPTTVGLPLANVPDDTLALWATDRLPGHFEVGGGTNYVGSRAASSTKPFDPVTGLLKEVPGYWTANAMIRHPLSDHVDVQINVNNLTNSYTYDQIHPGHIIPGAGRTVLLGFHFKF